jgi:hypothetical protein
LKSCGATKTPPEGEGDGVVGSVPVELPASAVWVEIDPLEEVSVTVVGFGTFVVLKVVTVVMGSGESVDVVVLVIVVVEDVAVVVVTVVTFVTVVLVAFAGDDVDGTGGEAAVESVVDEVCEAAGGLAESAGVVVLKIDAGADGPRSAMNAARLFGKSPSVRASNCPVTS